MDEKKRAMPKILPPNLRPKGRYIIFDILSEQPVIFKDFVGELWSSMINFLGELGASDTQMRVIKNLYDEKTQCGVIKCKNDSVEHVRASLTTITMISETRATVRIIGVTGTIKSAQNKYLGMRSLGSFL